MDNDRPVMIVDDEVHVRTSLRLVCEQRIRRPVIEAADAPSALDLAAKLSPCLVLMDIKMPGMNGVDALRELRRLSPATPIVIFTICASRATVQECLKAGASFYLRKDCRIEEICSALARFVPSESSAIGKLGGAK